MYSDYGYSAGDLARGYSYSSAADTGIMAFLAAYSIVMIIYAVVMIIANWKIFTKAGEKGWKSIIPIYNSIVLFKIAGLSPWWLLGYLAAIIPFVGGFAVLGITIYLMISLAKAFGKGGGFAAGLILLNPIFIMILAFGSAEYQLSSPKQEA